MLWPVHILPYRLLKGTTTPTVAVLWRLRKGKQKLPFVRPAPEDVFFIVSWTSVQLVCVMPCKRWCAWMATFATQIKVFTPPVYDTKQRGGKRNKHVHWYSCSSVAGSPFCRELWWIAYHIAHLPFVTAYRCSLATHCTFWSKCICARFLSRHFKSSSEV